MRHNVKEFVRLVISTEQLVDPVFEFGAYQVPEQLGFADLRPSFPGMTYIGCDMREGPGVDRVLDLHCIDQASATVGTALCLDTLEHVEEPRRAVDEMFRILKPSGVLIISSVMNFPIHDHPFDYWRFTPEAFRSLLKRFTASFVGYQGHEAFPHTVVGVGFKDTKPDLSRLEQAYITWRAEPIPTTPALVFIKRLVPPILAPALGRAYRSIVKRGKG